MTSILAMSLGAGGRTRTGTLSPAVDFESTTSTNSITPAQPRYYIVNRTGWQEEFSEKGIFLSLLQKITAIPAGMAFQSVKKAAFRLLCSVRQHA